MLCSSGYHRLSELLFLTNAVAYAWLAILTIARALRFPHAVWLDSFFTLVAANGVFGAGAHLRGVAATALHLWILAVFTWLVLIYFSFGVLAFRNTAHGANVVYGEWLLAIVGTESLVILGALIGPSTGDLSPAVFVLIHMLWGIGIGLYAIFITPLAYRIFFFAISAEDMTPLRRRRNQHQCRIDSPTHRQRHSIVCGLLALVRVWSISWRDRVRIRDARDCYNIPCLGE
jgi:hypothetical protein